jgi:hypothetical protein
MGAISTKTATQRELETLETLEKEIASEISEAFYHIGQKLLKIKRDRLYESVDCNSWVAYCRSGRLDYKVVQANNYIRASELRPKLPTLKVDTRVSTFGWEMKSVLELCKCETDKDAVRVAKAAIKLAKNTEQKLSAQLIATVRDRDTGKAQKELAAVSLEKHLDKLATILLHWRVSLEQVEAEQWDDCDTEILTRVKNESRDLAAYLRS